MRLTPAGFDEQSWRALLRVALTVVDSLPAQGYGTPALRFGGGTVLMLRFGHRISKDIDLFTYDAQLLSYLSPRLNDVADRVCRTYEEQANAVKLLLPEGDIDFIVAAPVIPGAETEAMVFEGRPILLDATAEILAKKLLYRAESFKARDVFDMAAALSLDRSSAMAALQATRSTRPALSRRLAQLGQVPEADLLSGVLATNSGRAYARGMVARLRHVIAEVDGAERPASGEVR